MKPIVITPVKNSLSTVKSTIESISESDIDLDYYIFNDFSDQETFEYLDQNQKAWKYSLINLEEHVSTPSPNYRTVLIMARKMALNNGKDLIIVESDVTVKHETLGKLTDYRLNQSNVGMVAAITIDEYGKINFPYNHIPSDAPPVIDTKRSLSFCCTLLSQALLEQFDFDQLREDKDWYDVHISRKSRSLGFKNYLLKEVPVLHRPHSSRPWKLEKYTNPVKYYWKKLFKGRDRI